VGRTQPRENCLWISPGDVTADSPETSAQKFARVIADRCNIVVTGLQVWRMHEGDPYDLQVEVAAVERVAAEQRMTRYHLFGFSAGATVALAAALALGAAVRTVAVLEPATIGDDEWDPAEGRWRRDLAGVRDLASERRPAAFRELMMGQGERPPPSLPPPPIWNGRMDKLEDMLAAVGFLSSDLARISQPTLVLSGGRSNARFLRLAERMVEVMPRAESVTFPRCSHLAPPHRDDPRQLREVLTDFWASA
jgi:pimeloyl-ACP methyl ester carboxylesterase